MKTYKWTEEQKKALRGSIRKWVKIVNGTGTDEGASNCPCCLKWNNIHNEYDECKGCPIMEFTGKSGCKDTPHELYIDFSVPVSENQELAISELNFLRAIYLAGGGK